METDAKTGLVDTAVEGDGRIYGESGTAIYPLPCVKQIAGEKPLFNTASPA